ncbi:MAG: MarR family winged helix-turn-helix transcriptional regulator [Atopococcus tabaci]|uniref:MarR family winged helix-turn-helix transcriptional regulator n=1 Tax=Atopococcus tabaci TaxID=269774 RepID=A0AA43ZSL8_9LACT|nr:MarR family winged helix-turn-helix transcriptional regulator [Atopococcus tabaci]
MIFNEVAIIEESALKNSPFSDLTVHEMHTIEAIGLSGRRNTSDVARRLKVTLGTVSVAVNNLVNKGYVERSRDPKDRRIYLLKLTKNGRVLYRVHHKLHMDMVKHTIHGFDKEEVAVLKAGLRNLYDYLKKAKMNLAKEEDNYE